MKNTTESLRKEIEEAINRNSAENGSNTPDFILADYLRDCLAAFDRAVKAREEWYGRIPDAVTPPEGVCCQQLPSLRTQGSVRCVGGSGERRMALERPGVGAQPRVSAWPC